jgi:hypothetical protein
MEIVSTLVVLALKAGATAIGKDVATLAVKDSYTALKSLLIRRVRSVDALVDAVEADPQSEQKHQLLAQQIDKSEATTDATVAEAAQQLIAAIADLQKVPKAAALFDFEELKVAGSVDLKEINATDTLIRAKRAEVGGDFKAAGINQKKN